MEQRISRSPWVSKELSRDRSFYEALGWSGAQQPDDEVCFFQAGEWSSACKPSSAGTERRGIRAARHRELRRLRGQETAAPARTGAPGSGPRPDDARPRPRSPGCTPARRTCARTGCTSSPSAAGGCGTVAVEDLNVGGHAQNRRLAQQRGRRRVGPAGRQLAYKTAWRGGRLSGRRPVLSIVENLLGLRAVKRLSLSERRLPVRAVRAGHRPGPERRPQPAPPWPAARPAQVAGQR